jgi:hypothetical protein
MSERDRQYGRRHREARAKVAPAVERGEVACARCGRWIVPGTPWDLGHADGDKTRYSGPEHRACNRATAGRATAGRATAGRATAGRATAGSQATEYRATEDWTGGRPLPRDYQPTSVPDKPTEPTSRDWFAGYEGP